LRKRCDELRNWTPGITVEVEGSTIKLRGSIRSWAEKREAERVAWSTTGITKAENYIIVTP
jgi:osmotically-inducible protein OsmY